EKVGLLYRLFPILYKSKIIKEALKSLLELGIDTNSLFDKAIPYGESASRYEQLAKYLGNINEIQVKLKKQI
ncbi:hypothetical protein IJ670_04040, partial [bacterium]|nr:hypothetical protein [bacterium]